MSTTISIKAYNREWARVEKMERKWAKRSLKRREQRTAMRTETVAY